MYGEWLPPPAKDYSLGVACAYSGLKTTLVRGLKPATILRGHTREEIRGKTKQNTLEQYIHIDTQMLSNGFICSADFIFNLL